MVNLRRCKVQAGDLPTSSRAITPEIIGKLWNFNHREENWVIKKYSPGRRDQKPSDTWGGPLFRRGLHLGYTLAYVCLLSVDEVLNIQSQDIEIADLDTLKVTLPFRRTGQFGHIQPFFLKKLPEEMKQLCPVRAYAEWIAETKITEGFTLRKMDSRDRFAADSTKHMVLYSLILIEILDLICYSLQISFSQAFATTSQILVLILHLTVHTPFSVEGANGFPQTFVGRSTRFASGVDGVLISRT
ncbi:hypothetical protein BDP27DRAFT_1431045 [Rhodocollybia butyracea]|uniref:Uncharacterized protein n=1 Tax=Rhodocollybia butyracea TaxID=206335 RepID=A0A9P5TYT5_9AGAR|nr:hypothetical protein BDP27DRAFT_1431045 [Rhodocollybia butyracea]